MLKLGRQTANRTSSLVLPFLVLLSRPLDTRTHARTHARGEREKGAYEVVSSRKEFFKVGSRLFLCGGEEHA